MEIVMSLDTTLQQNVVAALAWEPSLCAKHIGVAACDGVVTLTGHVKTLPQKRAAEIAAGRVKGVKAIAEEIEVHLPSECKKSDDEIAAAVIERLAWNASIPKDSVAIKVEKGFVTITGSAEWYFQKEAAGHDIRYVLGVAGVANDITVTARVSTKNLCNDISGALSRDLLFNSDVKVSADGGRIRLSGTVKSLNDRDIAFSKAWAAPGVTAVDNDILVA
jgi:osmotically-inducible protein OsmY